MSARTPFEVTLKHDAQDIIGTNVRKIQYLLKERGYNCLPDGFYGLRTEGKVREFQAHGDLKIDGIAGPKTLRELIVRVEPGSRGDAVRAVQIQFASLKRDGVYGPQTFSRITRFQSECGIKPDGFVGIDTWRALTLSPMLDLEEQYLRTRMQA